MSHKSCLASRVPPVLGSAGPPGVGEHSYPSDPSARQMPEPAPALPREKRENIPSRQWLARDRFATLANYLRALAIFHPQLRIFSGLGPRTLSSSPSAIPRRDLRSFEPVLTKGRPLPVED